MTLPQAKQIFAHLMEVSRKRALRPLEKRTLIRARQTLRSHKKPNPSHSRGTRMWIIPAIRKSDGKHVLTSVITESAKKALVAFDRYYSDLYTSPGKPYTDKGGFEGKGKKHNAALPAILNPKQSVKIYENVLRIEAQKGPGHRCDPGCKKVNHCYYHNFKRPFPSMFGLPDKSLLIRSK